MRAGLGPRALALALIGFYQRRLSPYKGFSCAYRGWCGAASCSVLGQRAIRRHGLLQGLAILNRRLARCGAAHRALREPPRRLHPQAGVCDLSCDVGDALDFLHCCDGCDWPRRRRGDDEVRVMPSRRKRQQAPPPPGSSR